MILDANGLIVGRFATIVAKKAMLGEKIEVINCEKAVISGKKEAIMEKYKKARDRGAPLKGPYFPRMPDRFVRRIIRGMLPYKQPKGAQAFKRVMCYSGIPKKFEGKNIETITNANSSKLPTLKKVTVRDICKYLGGIK